MIRALIPILLILTLVVTFVFFAVRTRRLRRQADLLDRRRTSERRLALEEHDSLSPGFMELLHKEDELHHPPDCPGCRGLVRRPSRPADDGRGGGVRTARTASDAPSDSFRACHGCLVDGLDHICGYTGF